MTLEQGPYAIASSVWNGRLESARQKEASAREYLRRNPRDIKAQNESLRAQLDYIHLNRDAQRELNEASKKQDNMYKDLKNYRNEITFKILIVPYIIVFIISISVGPAGALFWSSDYRQLVAISIEGENEIAYLFIITLGFANAMAMMKLMSWALKDWIADRIIAAKTRAPRP